MEEPVLEFRPPRGAITQPLKKLKINVFKVHKCAVCGFTTENHGTLVFCSSNTNCDCSSACR